MNELFEANQVYTVKEIAAVLRVSQVTLVKAIHKGKLAALRVEGQWRILGREAMHYLYRETQRALPGLRAGPPD